MSNLTHNSFSVYVYSKSLHVSSTHVLIIRRINYQYDIWYMSLYVGDCLVCRFGWSCTSTQTCIPDGHLHTVTYTRCRIDTINFLNPELNPICYLLALLAHHFLHVSRIRVKSLTLRLLMSYIYIYIWSTYS